MFLRRETGRKEKDAESMGEGCSSGWVNDGHVLSSMKSPKHSVGGDEEQL